MAKKEKLTMDRTVNMERKRGPEEGFTHEVFDPSFPATVALPASALLSMSLQLGEPQKGWDTSQLVQIQPCFC